MLHIRKKKWRWIQQRGCNIEIPEDYNEAILTANKEDWQCALLEQYQSLIDNYAYEDVEKCTQKTIDLRWVFTVQTTKFGVPTKFKARLVAKKYKQVNGIDSIESYAPVSDKATVRVFLTIAAKQMQKVYHIDSYCIPQWGPKRKSFCASTEAIWERREDMEDE